MNASILLRDTIIFAERDELLRNLRVSKKLDRIFFEFKHPLLSQLILGFVAGDIGNESFAPAFWQELALLAHEDSQTFVHSLGVTLLIYRMLTENGRTREYLEQSMRKVGITRGMLYAAALLHDVGKFVVREIIHDGRSRIAWAKLVNKTRGENVFDPKYLRPGTSEAVFDAYAHNAGLDPINCLPLEATFPEKTLLTLEQRGIPRTVTFREAIGSHEPGTNIIIGRHEGMQEVAEIAAWHHCGAGRPLDTLGFPIETSALRMAAIQCLHMADVLQALVSGFRSYTGKYSPLVALAIIIRDANAHHAMDAGLTRAFIADQFERVSRFEQAANDQFVQDARETVTRFVANG
jgi:hypothetical protein